MRRWIDAQVDGWGHQRITVPALIIKDNHAFADSRDVATTFGKNHADVVRAIRELVSAGVSNFAETPYVHPQNGQSYTAFLMDRDAFTLLVMSFTGKRALQWKMTYIAAFNAMEAELRKPVAQPVLTREAIYKLAWRLVRGS